MVGPHTILLDTLEGFLLKTFDHTVSNLLLQANMGVAVKFLDPAEDAPAAVAAQQTVGHFRDAAAISAFAGGCDVLTVEIEHIDADAMEEAARSSAVDVEPTPTTLRTIQVRLHKQLSH